MNNMNNANNANNASSNENERMRQPGRDLPENSTREMGSRDRDLGSRRDVSGRAEEQEDDMDDQDDEAMSADADADEETSLNTSGVQEGEDTEIEDEDPGFTGRDRRTA